jgi:proteasome lid subunit RPN8/RPN11
MLALPGPDHPDRRQPQQIVFHLELKTPGTYYLGGLPLKEFGAISPPQPSLVEDDSGEVVMRITRPIYQEILDALTSRKPESGGMLLGPKNHDAVTHFVFDENGHPTSTSFSIDHVGLTKVLRRFRACDIDMKGFVHSHPDGHTQPSSADIQYVLKTFSNPKNSGVKEFLLPIVCGGELYPHVITRGEARGSADVVPANLIRF